MMQDQNQANIPLFLRNPDQITYPPHSVRIDKSELPAAKGLIMPVSPTLPWNGARILSGAAHLRHVWEIHSHFKCPVVGACLSIEEHRRILRKAGHRTKGLAPYQLHSAIMGHLHEKNRISSKVERYLRHKYRDSVFGLACLREEAFMEAWHKGFQRGRTDSLLYVAALRDDLSEKMLAEIFGEIHMQSHANITEIMKSRRSLIVQKEANQKLAKLLKQEKKRSGSLKQKVSLMKSSLDKSRILMEKLKKIAMPEKKTGADNVKENRKLRERLRTLENQNVQQTKDLRYLEREKRKLQIDLFELQATNQQLADELRDIISQISAISGCNDRHCDETCPDFCICEKRILIVGGITKIRHLYRHLIESAGGVFDYHDGYMRNGKQNLEAQVRRSDLILCPVNCNSHGACHKVKKFCRKYDKTVRMLPSSSLSAISNALLEECLSV